MSQAIHMFCFTLCSLFGSHGKSIDIHTNTPGFDDFHDRLWNGKIDLANDDEKLGYGLVHLEKFCINIQTGRFYESLRIVEGHH